MQKLCKDQNVSLTDEHLVTFRDGIEASKAVSMGVCVCVYTCVCTRVCVHVCVYTCVCFACVCARARARVRTCSQPEVCGASELEKQLGPLPS